MTLFSLDIMLVALTSEVVLIRKFISMVEAPIGWAAENGFEHVGYTPGSFEGNL